MTITLDEMAALAKALVDADREVEHGEQMLKGRKESARFLREETIPSAMQELGLESITLSTGQKLEVKQEVYASIPVANRGEAYQWLNEKGFGGLIKTDVSVPFGKNEEELAKKFVLQLSSMGYASTAKQNVHPSTLKAFIKEQLAKGNDIPLALFGARPVWTAKVK